MSALYHRQYECDLNAVEMQFDRSEQSPMSSEAPENAGNPVRTEQARHDIDRLVREAFVATLATLDRRTGHPYASLVEVATSPQGRPILLISRLAQHTSNLEADNRASLLFDTRAGAANPLAGPRATLIGRMARDDEALVRARFLRRHPSAGVYVHFADFVFWSLRPETAHFIGGFGRIEALAAPEMATALRDDGVDARLAGAEGGLIAGLQERCALAAPAWTVGGIDCGGVDLVASGAGGRRGCRLAFARSAVSVQEAQTLAENALALFSTSAAAKAGPLATGE
jgi:heme iron utilization protein